MIAWIERNSEAERETRNGRRRHGPTREKKSTNFTGSRNVLYNGYHIVVLSILPEFWAILSG